jgi:hypothetical protein
MSFLAPIRPIRLIADIGIPMIAFSLPAMVAALIPVILVEALYMRKRIVCGWWTILWTVGWANVVSTVVGVPIAWLVMVFCEFGIAMPVGSNFPASFQNSAIGRFSLVLLSAPWLNPLSEGDAAWAIPLAAFVLLVPFLFISIWIEQIVVRRLLPKSVIIALQTGDTPDQALKRAVRNANVISYSILFAAATIWLLYGLFHR